MSRTMTAMPARTAIPSWVLPAEVIGSVAAAARVSTLRLVTVTVPSFSLAGRTGWRGAWAGVGWGGVGEGEA